MQYVPKVMQLTEPVSFLIIKWYDIRLAAELMKAANAINFHHI
jgi:hypothetical protein